MKKTLLIIIVLLGSLSYKPVDAQVRTGVNFNVGLQPIWGPTGYDRAENYYLPDIDVFYNIPNRQYIYQDRGRWTFANSLPSRYRNYDLYNGYKVVINENQPYRNAENYRNQYARYKNNHSQEAIRNSHEEKYFENRDHPEHDKWRGNGNGRGNGNENGNGKKDKENGHDNGRRGHDNK